MNQHKDKFVALLEELFQLNQPELDFGLYRILHARSAQIKSFVQNELKEEIDKVFASQTQASAHDLLKAARLKVEQTLGEYAVDANGDLKPELKGTPIGKEYELARKQAQEGGGPLADDAQVYDHLYRFFSRYYDKGDFMSKRYFVSENDTRATPYAIPYDGREVMLHWANKDQYYIKSSEYLANYTVDLAAAKKLLEQGTQGGLDFAAPDQSLKVHFRLAEATEGEHNNVKEGQERFFLIHSPDPVKLEANNQGEQELVIQFEYRPDPEKSGQSSTWQQKRLADAETLLRGQLAALPDAKPFVDALSILAPTDKQSNRSLLAKYLGQYTSRNTMDYFIHKNLGGFLRRELDFYIKNEIMRLDDIEAADAPRVETYLKKIQSLRKIARRIIDFLAQIEDFQKNLWLKKKFVVETNYCITLDRIPESFYQEIATNEQQRKQWVSLFSIDEQTNELLTGRYTVPLSIDFLKCNQHLIVDTALFSDNFKNRLISQIANIDSDCDGILINSDNFQALKLISHKFKNMVDSVYIDPPYNTDATPIIYKNGYKSSSWLSLINDRIEITSKIMTKSSILCLTIDDVEVDRVRCLLDSNFPERSLLGTVAIKNNPAGRTGTVGFSVSHEYALFYGSTEYSTIGRLEHSDSQKARYKENDEDGSFEWTNFRKHGGTNTYRSARPRQYYPIYVDGDKIRFPEMEWNNELRNWTKISPPTETEETLYPIDENGRERIWDFVVDTAIANLSHLKVKKDAKGNTAIYRKWRLNSDGLLPQTIWDKSEYSAAAYGTNLLTSMFGTTHAFSFPKSLNAVVDCLKVTGIKNNKNAVILDYFAGSGTTAHATISTNRSDGGNRKYILAEQGTYFESALIPRIKKAAYSATWKDGKPFSCDGVSHCFKYLRLESYEDTLNNLVLPKDAAVDAENPANSDLARDYLLKYWLDFETAGSPSLLNVGQFTDPTNYTLMVKQPGSDAQVAKKVDLLETFNWLIGLHVALLDQPRHYQIEMVRETDPDLPKDQETRWVSKAIKERDDGEFWFRWVEGHTLAVAGDESSRQRVLVLWRKLTGDAGRDQAALEAYLAAKKLNPLESEFDFIYINGSHALPSDGGASTRVRLIEETFAQRMWEDA